MKCFACEHSLDFKLEEKISLREECPKCGQDIHVCKMCKFYDVNSYNECKEPMSDRIVDKEKANYCDYFKLGDINLSDKKDDLLAQANALFKK